MRAHGRAVARWQRRRVRLISPRASEDRATCVPGGGKSAGTRAPATSRGRARGAMRAAVGLTKRSAPVAEGLG